MIQAVLNATRLPVMVMLRPRGGDFCFDTSEKEVMRHDLEQLLSCDSRIGIVLGALTPEGHVDVATCRDFCERAGGRSLTFHRAFDLVRDPFESLERIVDLGIDRILTSGHCATAEAGIPLLTEMVQRSRERIAIMPASGINARNASRIVRETGARQIHFSGREGPT